METEYEVEVEKTGSDRAKMTVTRVPKVGAGVAVIVIILVIVSLVIAIALLPIAFPISLIITGNQYANKGIPVTDLVLTNRSNVSVVENSDPYDRIDDDTYLLMESYMEDGKTVSAYATFQNQEDRKKFHGVVYYEQPTHVNQSTIIRVYTDGQLAYESGELGRDTHCFDINIEGVSEIRIEAFCVDSELNYYGEVVKARLYFYGELNK
jgi:hypothetical protein